MMTDASAVTILTTSSLAPGPWVKIQDKAELEMDEYVVQGEGDGDDAEGPRHRYYESKKLLGQLYRAIDERKIWVDDIKTMTAPGLDFWDVFLGGVQSQVDAIGYACWDKRLDEAQRIRLTWVLHQTCLDILLY